MPKSAKTFATLLIAILAAVNSEAAHGSDRQTPTPISFVHDVAPILVRNCQACHGPETFESNYRLDSFERLLEPGDYQTTPLTAGDLDNSELYRLVSSEDAEERMPKNGHRLSDAEIAKIAAWIEGGIQFDGRDASAPISDQIPPLKYPAPPETYSMPMPITAMTFSPDGSRLLVGGYHEILVFVPESAALTQRLPNMPQRVYDVEICPTGMFLAVAGGAPGVSGEVRLLACEETTDGQLQFSEPDKSLARHDDVFFAVAFRPDGERLAAASADGSIHVFDVATGEEQLQLQNHANWVTDLCFNSDGSYLASASRDKTAKVFDAQSGELITTYSENNAPVRAVAFTPDGDSILSAAGRSVKIWKIDGASVVGELAGFGGDIYSLVLHEKTAIAAAADNTARQFTLEDRQQIRSLDDHSNWVLSLAWHDDSKRLACGCFDGTVTIWNLEDGAKVKHFVAVPR